MKTAILSCRRFASLVAGALFCIAPALAAPPVAGPNVNMVSGTKWPEGDPFLTKQNEPSIAVSSRNSRHLLAGSNDYRLVPVEIAEALDDPEAWIQIYKSIDGGASWRSTPIGGCPINIPECNDSTGLTSSLKQLRPNFGADPTVRPGPYGTFFVSFIAGTRNTGANSVVAVQRFVDKNNDIQRTTDVRGTAPDGRPMVRPAQDPMLPDLLNIIAVGTPGQTTDKPWVVADVPGRSWNTGKTCDLLSWTKGNAAVSNAAETVNAFNVYVSYANFTGQGPKTKTQIYVAASNDCGKTFPNNHLVKVSNTTGANQGTSLAVDPLTGAVYVVWRNFDGPQQILMNKSTDGGFTWLSQPVKVASIIPYDQGSTNVSMRTLGFPTVAVSVKDGKSFVHVAFTARKAAPATSAPYACTSATAADCDARIVITTSTDGGKTWPAATPVDGNFAADPAWPNFNPANPSGRGHQIQPSLTFSAGKLLVTWLDQRLDHTEGVLKCPANKTCTTVNDLVEVREAKGNLDSACNNAVLPAPYGPACWEYRAGTHPPSVWTTYITDGTPGLVRRHTLDVFAATADPSATPTFASSRVSQYAFGSTVAGTINADGTLTPATPPRPYDIRQKEVNPPNLPLFANGTGAFLGDYIDAAGQSIVATGSPAQPYKYNVGGSANDAFTTSGRAPEFHVAFTDNRDVIPPVDGNWVTPTCLTSAFTKDANGNVTGVTNFSGCSTPGYAGNRNQNVYTAILAENSVAFAGANSKLLNSGTSAVPRGFVVTIQNLGTATATYTLSIPPNQTGVKAAFNQDSFAPGSATPLLTQQVIVQPHSSSTRTVWATATAAGYTGATILLQFVKDANADGTFSTVVALNPDPSGVLVTNGDGNSTDIVNDNLGNVVLSNAVLTNNALSNNALTNNVLTNNALTNAVLSNVVLSNAVLSNLQPENLDPNNAALSNNVLTNNVLSNVVLSNAVLSNNALSNAVLSNVVLSNNALNVALTNLDPANVALSNAVLSNNALTNVVLSNLAQNNALSNAMLSNNALSNAVLSNVVLSNNALTNNVLSNNALSNNVLSNAPLSDPSGGANPDADPLRAIETGAVELAKNDFLPTDLTNSNFRETSFPIRNHGNTDTTLSIKLLLRDAICTDPTFQTPCASPPGYKLQLILRKVDFAPVPIPPTANAKTPSTDGQPSTGRAFRIGLAQRNTEVSNVGTLPLIDPKDPSLGKFQLNQPGAATLSLGAGEWAYATIRAIGVGGTTPPDPADLLRWGVKTVAANATNTGNPLIITTLNFPANSVTALQDPGLLVSTSGGSGTISGTAICTDKDGTPLAPGGLPTDPQIGSTAPPGYIAQAQVPCAQAPITVSDDGTTTRTAKLSFTPKYWGTFFTLVRLQDGSPAPEKDQQVIKVVVNPATPVVTFRTTGPNPFPATLTYQVTLDLNTLIAAGGPITSTSPTPITFSTVPGTACQVDPDGHTLRLLQASPPNCVFNVNQAGNETYAPIVQPSPAVFIVINKADQVLTFAAAPSPTYNQSFVVSVTSSSPTAPPSGIASTFTSLTPGICAVASVNVVSPAVTSATISTQSAGTCTIAANEAGNGNYNPVSPQVTQDIVIKKADQALAFGAAPSPTYNQSFVVSVTSSSPTAPPSGIPATFTSLTPGICAVASVNVVSPAVTSATISTQSAGTCTIAANEAGNGSYNPVTPQVTQDITIAKAAQNIAFGTGPAGVTFGDAPVAISATTSSPTAPASIVPPIVFASTTPTVCTVGSATMTTPTATASVTIVGAGTGTCTITADQAGNGNYNSAPTATMSFGVAKAPTQFTVQPSYFTPFGSPTTTITGKLNRVGVPTVYPTDTPTVALKNGAVTITYTPGLVGPDGAFTITDSSVAPGTYTLTFDYAASANFQAAAQVTSSLRVEGFSAAAAMNVARAGHTSTLLQNGNVLVTGGVDNSGVPTKTAEIYCAVVAPPCTAVDTFVSTGSLMGTARAGHTATLLTDGTVLVAGGFVDGSSTTTATAEVYCAAVSAVGGPCTAADGSFKSATSPMATARMGHTATLLPNNTVLIAGGAIDLINPPTNAAEIYCSAVALPLCGAADGSFQPSPGNMTTKRDSHTATLLVDGTVLVTGGEVDEFGTPTKSAEIYCSAVAGPCAAVDAGTFKVVASVMSSERSVHTASLLQDGRVLVAGGYDLSGTPTASADVYCAVVAGTCLAGGTFKAVGGLVAGRANQTASLLTDGLVVAAGGVGVPSTVLATSGFFEPGTTPADVFIVGASMASARSGHAATRLPDGRVLVTGGRDGLPGTVLNSAEIYNGPPP